MQQGKASSSPFITRYVWAICLIMLSVVSVGFSSSWVKYFIGDNRIEKYNDITTAERLLLHFAANIFQISCIFNITSVAPY